MNVFRDPNESRLHHLLGQPERISPELAEAQAAATRATYDFYKDWLFGKPIGSEKKLALGNARQKLVEHASAGLLDDFSAQLEAPVIDDRQHWTQIGKTAAQHVVGAIEDKLLPTAQEAYDALAPVTLNRWQKIKSAFGLELTPSELFIPHEHVLSHKRALEDMLYEVQHARSEITVEDLIVREVYHRGYETLHEFDKYARTDVMERVVGGAVVDTILPND